MKKYILILILVLLLQSYKSKSKVNQKVIENTKISKNWIKPPDLKKGDTVMLLTPASYLKDSIQSVSNALDSLKSWGLNYKLSKHIFDKEGTFAGIDKERAADFQKAIDNPNIKAIWCTRGGYGAVRMIDRINFKALQKNPKWIIGYSDVTAIHNEIHNNGVQSIHGVMPVNFKIASEKKIKAINSFKNALFGIKNKYEIESSLYNKEGITQGVLVGGNLTLLHTMLGSKTSIKTENKILFIEDVGEKIYHIDRMLYSLKRAGYFDKCNGLIVGGFTEIKDSEPQFAKNVEEVIINILKEYDFPILFNFPAGHQTDNRALIMGAKVKITVKKETSILEFL